jgi:hypothetical protein
MLMISDGPATAIAIRSVPVAIASKISKAHASLAELTMINTDACMMVEISA